VSALLGALPAPAGLRPETTLASRAALAAAGLPSRRQEDWRFTDTAPIAAVAPQLLAPEAQPALPPVAEGHHRVVLDGRAETLAAVAWSSWSSRARGPQDPEDTVEAYARFRAAS
jgi:hypothetical protein